MACASAVSELSYTLIEEGGDHIIILILLEGGVWDQNILSYRKCPVPIMSDKINAALLLHSKAVKKMFPHRFLKMVLKAFYKCR